MIIQNYKFFLVDSRGLWPLASAIQEKPSPPFPWWGKPGWTWGRHVLHPNINSSHFPRFKSQYLPISLATSHPIVPCVPTFRKLTFVLRAALSGVVKRKNRRRINGRFFFNSRFHPISFLSSFWLIPNFLSSFIELWCSRIFLSYGGFTRERAFVLWRILCCNADWVFAVSTNTLRDYSFHTHDTPNTPYRSNNSTRVSYCWMFSLKEVLLRSASRSICINHTLVNGVHSTLTCGATNKSYWP